MVGNCISNFPFKILHILSSVGWHSSPPGVRPPLHSPGFLLELSQRLESLYGCLCPHVHPRLQNNFGFKGEHPLPNFDDNLQPASFNNMDHEKVYKRNTSVGVIVFAVILLSIGNNLCVVGRKVPCRPFLRFLQTTNKTFPGYSNPAKVKPNLHAYLVDQDMWEAMEPNYRIILSTAFFSVVNITSLVVVRHKTKSNAVITTTQGKYKNPIKNISFVILVVVIVYTALQLIFFKNTSIVFPRFSVGFCTTVILLFLLTGNPATRQYVRR